MDDIQEMACLLKSREKRREKKRETELRASPVYLDVRHRLVGVRGLLQLSSENPNL